MTSRAQDYCEALKEYKHAAADIETRYARRLRQLRPLPFEIAEHHPNDPSITIQREFATLNSEGRLQFTNPQFTLDQQEALSLAQWITTVFTDSTVLEERKTPA